MTLRTRRVCGDRKHLFLTGEGLPEVKLEQIQLQFDLQNGMRKLLVGSNKMYIVTNNCAYRIDLSDPSNVSQIKFPLDSSESLSLTNAWLNLSGNCLFVQVNSKSYFLLHSSYHNFKPLSRFKGLHFKFMTFSSYSDVDNSLDIVAVTRDEAVYVASIKCHDPASHGSKRDDKYVRHVYSGKSETTGIIFSNNYHVLHLFDVNGFDTAWHVRLSSLHDLIDAFRQIPDTRRFFALGILYQFHASSSFYYCISKASGQIYSNDPHINNKMRDWGKHILHLGSRSLIATDVNILYLRSDLKALVMVSKMLQKAPFVIPLTPIVGDELVLGLTSDAERKTRWLFTQSGVYELSIINEFRSLWYSFYKVGSYDLALRMLDRNDGSADSRHIRDMIYIKQAYDFLLNGGLGLDFSEEMIPDQEMQLDSLKKGISLLAKLQEPLEKVTLMLSNIADDKCFNPPSRELLREYLRLKMSRPWHFGDTMKNVVLTNWIVRLFLKAIQNIDSCYTIGYPYGPHRETGLSNHRKQVMKLDDSLFSFLTANIRHVDNRTIYEMMIKMGFEDRLTKFAHALDDYEYIAYRLIDFGMWPGAIKAMKQLRCIQKQKLSQVVVDTSFILLLRAPEITIDFWLTLDNFSFERFLPAILHFNELHRALSYSQNPTIRFLLRLIHDDRSVSPLITNQYLSLLISHPLACDDHLVTREIMRTLEKLRRYREPSKENCSFDANFLLRSCLHFQRLQPAVSILMNDFQRYETALALALDNGSRSLGELVLKEFDEYRKINQSRRISHESREIDLFYLDSISARFTNERLKARKSLWYTYARYLFATVYKEEWLSTIGATKNVSDQSCTVLKAKFFSDSTTCFISEKKVPDLQSSQLSKILSYLLDLSRSFGGSTDLLSFKDILPLLPESILINHFKDDIVQSLLHYNDQLNHLALEMQESAATSANLKIQIANSNSLAIRGQIYTIIEPGEECNLCKKTLMQENSMVFQNCHHGCHKECATRFFLLLKGDYHFKKIFHTFKHSLDYSQKNDLRLLLIKACPLCNESNLNKLEDELTGFKTDIADILAWSVTHVTSSHSQT